MIVYVSGFVMNFDNDGTASHVGPSRALLCLCVWTGIIRMLFRILSASRLIMFGNRVSGPRSGTTLAR